MRNIWTLALMGISIVFILLIILMAIIWSFKFLFKSRNGNNKVSTNLEKPHKEYIKPPQVKKIENQENITEEELFAIISAISSYISQAEFEIKSVKRTQVSEKIENKIKNKWISHEPTFSWNPYYNKRWR